jgi:protein O-GlcNAc transferase
MTNAESPLQTATLAIEQAFQQAFACQQAGQLQDAERLYHDILKTTPNHPNTNHNLGILAVQMKQPASGLPYFMAALDADPTRGQYWLNYIDALFQAGQLEDARGVLELAQQQGLQGDEVEALALRLNSGAQVAQQLNTDNRQASSKVLPAPTTAPQNSHADPKSKPDKLGKPAGKSAPHKGKTPSPQEINALVALFTEGRLTEAATLAQTMTVRFPRHEFGWKALGAVYKQMGRSADALAPMQKASAMSPGDIEAQYNLGVTLQDLGRLGEAAASYRRALQINPNYADAHSNLGVIHQELGRLDEAESSYRRTLQINPNYAKAHSNLGAILQKLGRLNEAEVSLRKALEIKPDFAEGHSNLGNILKDLGRLDEAETSYRRVLDIAPYYAEAHYNLANILKKLGRLSEAETSYRNALEIKPDFVEVLNNLGSTLHDLGRLGEAEASFNRALQIKPDYAAAHGNLGITLKDLGRLNDAEVSYRRALEIEPNNAKMHNNLGDSLQHMNRLDNAEASYRRALEIEPVFDMAHSNLLFCLLHNETGDAEMLFSEHLRFGEQFETPLRTSWLQHSNSRNPDRCLQVGFVSGDLRDHVVASFIEPVLAHLAGYSQFSLHAYSNHNMEDKVTQRLRGYFAHWHPVASLSDAALAEKIRADGIDILIDLSGHTAKNRLLAVARKPAPVQASWMGYPGTTGLSAMDYYLADRFLLPPGQLDAHFTEKIVRLPANAPFLPFSNAPPVNALPASSNGYVTFGSFNRLSKLSRSVIALWSQLLRNLPDSKMVLVGVPESDRRVSLIDWFAQEGIARERLSFHEHCSLDIYLGLHHQVDICLDTFPYNGGTTTCHALWMGIPTLTLTGDTLPGRVGAGVLGHMGLDEFVADNAADFVHKGLFCAGNLTALSNIRAGLRERFTNSAMGQPELIAAGLERALRIMWQRWCAELPVESFEVTRQEIADVARGN